MHSRLWIQSLSNSGLRDYICSQLLHMATWFNIYHKLTYLWEPPWATLRLMVCQKNPQLVVSLFQVKVAPESSRHLDDASLQPADMLLTRCVCCFIYFCVHGHHMLSLRWRPVEFFPSLKVHNGDVGLQTVPRFSLNGEMSGGIPVSFRLGEVIFTWQGAKHFFFNYYLVHRCQTLAYGLNLARSVIILGPQGNTKSLRAGPTGIIQHMSR